VCSNWLKLLDWRLLAPLALVTRTTLEHTSMHAWHLTYWCVWVGKLLLMMWMYHALKCAHAHWCDCSDRYSRSMTNHVISLACAFKWFPAPAVACVVSLSFGSLLLLSWPLYSPLTDLSMLFCLYIKSISSSFHQLQGIFTASKDGEKKQYMVILLTNADRLDRVTCRG